ncbi:hypothetical protein OKW21_000231 [Catalinimonas alkaloidigena]|uniref:hypothetical protein n=1 Tax=Catalimonadaceae TaxID=1522127 RepID=UPI0024074343|nr:MULTISPECIES: hypothetical protein [Catalimonadaceae]MDF9794968.1 hypothetical protein [Catalinimonas alkaloidigena]WKN33777.1 hypothetical protein PZB74_10620 [Porifericola rhodea]
MNDFEMLIQRYLQQAVAPIIEQSVKKAIRESLPNHALKKKDDDKEYLNASESAAFIGDTMSTFYKRIFNKEIPRYGTPKRILCKKSDLEAFILRGRKKSKTELEEEAEELLSRNKRRK